MKRIKPILIIVIALSVYSCQKDQSVKIKANGALSTSKMLIRRDTTPPPLTNAMPRDTTPPPLK